MCYLYVCRWLKLSAAAPASRARQLKHCLASPAPLRPPSKCFSGPLSFLGQDLPICHEQRLHFRSSQRFRWQVAVFAGTWGRAPTKVSHFTGKLPRHTSAKCLQAWMSQAPPEAISRRCSLNTSHALLSRLQLSIQHGLCSILSSSKSCVRLKSKAFVLPS